MKETEPEFQQILRLMSQFKTEIEAVQLLHKAMYRNMCHYVDDYGHAVLTNMYMPGEIFYAMGLTPFITEYVTGTMATLRKTPELLDIVEQRTQTTGFCSYITSIIGIFEKRHLPVPGFLVLPSEICEDTPKIFEYLHYRYQKRTKLFFIDIPFSSDASTVDYVASQLEQLACFLESQTGRPLDEKRLADTLELSNRAKRTGDKVKEIRKTSPPLIPGKYGINMASVIGLFGTQEAVDILENLYADIQQRKEKGNFTGHGRSRRLFWVHVFPPYASKLIQYLERELDATIVGEEIFYIPKVTLDPASPFRSLAQKILPNPVHGSIQGRKIHIL